MNAAAAGTLARRKSVDPSGEATARGPCPLLARICAAAVMGSATGLVLAAVGWQWSAAPPEADWWRFAWPYANLGLGAFWFVAWPALMAAGGAWEQAPTRPAGLPGGSQEAKAPRHEERSNKSRQPPNLAGDICVRQWLGMAELLAAVIGALPALALSAWLSLTTLTAVMTAAVCQLALALFVLGVVLWMVRGSERVQILVTSLLAGGLVFPPLLGYLQADLAGSGTVPWKPLIAAWDVLQGAHGRWGAAGTGIIIYGVAGAMLILAHITMRMITHDREPTP